MECIQAVRECFLKVFNALLRSETSASYSQVTIPLSSIPFLMRQFHMLSVVTATQKKAIAVSSVWKTCESIQIS